MPLCCLWKMMNTCLGKRIPSFFFFSHSVIRCFRCSVRVHEFSVFVQASIRSFVCLATVVWWMSQALPCGKHVLASRITCACQNNVPIEHAVHLYLRVLLRYRWVAGERTWFFVIAFACGDSVSGMRSFSFCTMSLNRSFLFCNSPFSMMVVRSSMCRCCGVRHTNAQPSVSVASCPMPQ